ncbi:Tfp pilus assembly protein FimT/FimU [Thermodesulfobacteriota bacterium]
MDYDLKKSPGFTFVEVITVVFIIGITTAIVVSRLFFSNTDLIAQTEVLKSHLRYAQARAMNSEKIWGIKGDNQFYWLFEDGNKDNKVLLPGENADTVDLSPIGIKVKRFTVSFDAWGKPYTDDKADKPQTEDRTLTLSDGSEERYVVVTKNTGFIE